jgi:N(2)-fixation sustaining protein CowN
MTDLNPRDRYTSFAGIDCEGNASKIIDRLRQLTQTGHPDDQLVTYFTAKLAQQETLGQDALFFICSQINVIHALFDTCQDQEALHWLAQIEDECC